jgi:hypothetical protein
MMRPANASLPACESQVELKPEFMCLLQEENKICITFEKWSLSGGA